MRDLFLLDDDIIYLNHGSFGACPRPVFEQYQALQRELERQPVDFFMRQYDTRMNAARESLAAYLHTSADGLIFVPNATTGLNIVARSLPLNPGDEVVMTTHEYGALDLTWKYVREQRGIHLRRQSLPRPLVDDAAIVDALWEGVTERTRVIFLSHITSSTAMILPVQQICQRAREQGILTIIDGAHAPGQIDLNLDAIGADFYSGNCHKWLCAPKGAAFLYAREENHLLIDPLVISWGADNDTFAGRNQWQGTRDVSAFLSVPAAIDFLAAHDWAQVRQQCHDLAVYAMHRICELTGFPPRAMPRYIGQMAAAPLPECDPQQLNQQLHDDYGIEVPITTHDDRQFIRVSVQAYNAREDIDALLDALTAIFRKR